MKLNYYRILIAAQFAAPYEGNFIASCRNLKEKLYSEYEVECAFLFPRKMASQPWARCFIESNKVFLSGSDSNLITNAEADTILQEFKPDLIYTHFEGYDVPMFEAIKRSGKEIRQVWHMHDTLAFHKNRIKAAYQVWAFFRHYGFPVLWSKILKKKTLPGIIGVNKHELDFITKFRLGLPIHKTVIQNGVDVSRIKKGMYSSHETFTFLAFAGRNVQKRVDLLLFAAEKLVKKGVNLKVVIVDGGKPTVAETIFRQKPHWLTEIKPQEDINSVFALADCFVSTSVHETFSYAIAEASIFGLPVIQSDIEGTQWNSHNPSTFLFLSEDINSLSETMHKVMAIPENEMRQMCALTAINNIRDYSMDSWSKKVIDFFNTIIV